jgi:drug/metabolite transporter (DMT)-like permease
MFFLDMNILHLLLIISSAALLVFNQVILKLWIEKYDVIVWPLSKQIYSSLLSIEIPLIIISLLGGGIIWIYLLKKIDFSIIFQMMSLTYVLGILAAKFIFRENIPMIRWMGLFVIILGVFLISRDS